MNLIKSSIIPIIILFIFFLLNKTLRNYLENFDICDINVIGPRKRKQNIRKKIIKKIIVGFDENNNPIEEEMEFNQYCAEKDQKCLVDSEGEDTCCDSNLKCIRKKGNFQYKVCSDKRDACNIQYKTFLKIFNGYYWNKLLDKLKAEEISQYEDMKASIEGKVKNLCQGKELDGSLFNQVVQSWLNELYLESDLFATIVFDISLI